MLARHAVIFGPVTSSLIRHEAFTGIYNNIRNLKKSLRYTYVHTFACLAKHYGAKKYSRIVQD